MTPAPPRHGRPAVSAGLLVSLLLGGAPRAAAQEPLTLAPDTAALQGIDGGRLAVVGLSAAALVTAITIYQQNGWWQDDSGPFHVEDNPTYALGVDKVGHFYGATLGQWVGSRSLRWAGMGEEGAAWGGAGLAFAFQTYIEIRDGYSKTWGFDRADELANLLGALYPVAQYYWEPLRAVNLKLSYHPSPVLGTSGPAPGQTHLVIDDYEGQTYWLSVIPAGLFWRGEESPLPRWLGVAAGYGARDIAGPSPVREYYLGIDLDMREIIPQTTPLLRTLSELLNFIRLPLPAVQISPDVIWYGAYF